jgi:hypothetical protein
VVDGEEADDDVGDADDDLPETDQPDETDDAQGATP